MHEGSGISAGLKDVERGRGEQVERGERERENEGGKERSGHERAGATMDCCKGGGGGGGRTLSRSLKLDGGNSGNNVPRRGKGGICQFDLDAISAWQ